MSFYKPVFWFCHRPIRNDILVFSFIHHEVIEDFYFKVPWQWASRKKSIENFGLAQKSTDIGQIILVRSTTVLNYVLITYLSTNWKHIFCNICSRTTKLLWHAITDRDTQTCIGKNLKIPYKYGEPPHMRCDIHVLVHWGKKIYVVGSGHIVSEQKILHVCLFMESNARHISFEVVKKFGLYWWGRIVAMNSVLLFLWAELIILCLPCISYWIVYRLYTKKRCVQCTVWFAQTNLCAGRIALRYEQRPIYK